MNDKIRRAVREHCDAIGLCFNSIIKRPIMVQRVLRAIPYETRYKPSNRRII